MSDETFLREQLLQLERRLAGVEALLQSQTRRICVLEKQQCLTSPTTPAPAPPPLPVEKTAPPPMVSPEPAAAVIPAREAPSTEAEESWESKIGGNWLNKFGMVAIILGVVYFLKYAIDNNWIGETGRVILGVLTGLGFLAGGEKLRQRGYPNYGLTCSSGGIAILYFSVFAAFNFYHLLTQFPAFLLMALITATAVAMSVRYDSRLVAFFALIGGFLTPVMLGTGNDNQAALFAYIAILDLGILALAYFKNWSALNLVAFILTQIIFLAWSSSYYAEEKLWRTEVFLTLFFLIFAIVAFLYNIVHQQKTTICDQCLILLNGGAYFLWSYFLLEDKYSNCLGLFAILLAVFYVFLGSFVRRRAEADNYLLLLLLGMAFTCLTVAIPIQLKQNWITIGWSVEALVICWIGFLIDNDKTRLGALVAALLVAFRLLAYDSASWAASRADFTFLANKRGLTFLVAIAVILAMASLYARQREKLKGMELPAVATLIIGANLLALFFMTTEIAQSYQLQYGEALDDTAQRAIHSQQQLAISAFWAVYSILLVIAGILRRFQPVRLLAILLFGITIAKVFIFDLAEVEKIYRVLSFIILGSVLLAASFLYQKHRNQINDFMLK